MAIHQMVVEIFQSGQNGGLILCLSLLCIWLMTSHPSSGQHTKPKNPALIGVTTAGPEITRGWNFNLNYCTDPLKPHTVRCYIRSTSLHRMTQKERPRGVTKVERAMETNCQMINATFSTIWSNS